MSHTTAILGKASVGKTFCAAHLAMALGHLGEKTLVVGCDQKRDTVRALGGGGVPSLMEVMETVRFDSTRVAFEELTYTVNTRVDVMEIGPSQLLVGHYADVLEVAFQVLDINNAFHTYDRVLFDVNDERFDDAHAIIFRRVEGAIGVTDDSQEALFVLNRLLRAVLIGGAEFEAPLRMVGVAHARSLEGPSFRRYVEQTGLAPLLTIPEHAELAPLRQEGRTLFARNDLPDVLAVVMMDFLRVAEALRGGPVSITPVMPLADEEIWQLAPPVKLPA